MSCSQPQYSSLLMSCQIVDWFCTMGATSSIKVETAPAATVVWLEIAVTAVVSPPVVAEATTAAAAAAAAVAPTAAAAATTAAAAQLRIV